MAKHPRKSKLSRAICRARKLAGSMPKLHAALGNPPLNLRTLENWEQEHTVPSDFIAAAVVERLEKWMEGARNETGRRVARRERGTK